MVSRCVTAQQVLWACVESDAGRPSTARQLAAPAVLAGYQDDWLEVAPTTLSMWEQVEVLFAAT
jgi:hypothetical protein